MKRDFDLIREILLQIEATPVGQFTSKISYDGANPETIMSHVALLIEAGLVDGPTLKTNSGGIMAKPTGLTWAGHDFLDSIRDESLWQKAKTTILKPAGGVALSVLLDWAKDEAKRRLGIN